MPSRFLSRIGAAIDLLEAALKIHPTYSSALNELGVQYLKLKDLDKAEAALTAALQDCAGVLRAKAEPRHRAYSEAKLRSSPERIAARGGGGGLVGSGAPLSWAITGWSRSLQGR